MGKIKHDVLYLIAQLVDRDTRLTMEEAFDYRFRPQKLSNKTLALANWADLTGTIEQVKERLKRYKTYGIPLTGMYSNLDWYQTFHS